MSMEEPTRGNHGTRDCGLFFLDVVDNFPKDSVKVIWLDEPRPSNAEVDSLIEKAWIEQEAKCANKDIMLFNGQMCRLIDYRIKNHRLELTFGPVSFKEFIGTNATQAYLRHLHGVEVLADPVGVSASVCTSDGFLIFGKRSCRVIQYPDRLHPIGGAVEPCDGSGVPCLFDAIARELEEETGIPPQSILESTCIGMVRDRNTVQPELIFDITVDHEMSEVFRMYETAADKLEHSSIIPIRNHPATVVTFIQQQFTELTPIGIASLLLHGQRHWGSGWFANARGYLESVI